MTDRDNKRVPKPNKEKKKDKKEQSGGVNTDNSDLDVKGDIIGQDKVGGSKIEIQHADNVYLNQPSPTADQKPKRFQIAITIAISFGAFTCATLSLFKLPLALFSTPTQVVHITQGNLPTATSIAVTTSTPSLIPPTSSPIPIHDGMVLVFVPTGEFVMGYNFVVHPVYTDRRDAIPEHTVHLDSFYIDKTEVTNGMYASCVRVGNCTPPISTSSNRYTNYYGNSQYNNYPVINIRWTDANAYCQWAGRRLPTEAEWEKAARGTDGRAYPWGNGFPNSTLLNFNFNFGDTTPVDDYSSGASPYGALNMAGNVWEWVADWYNESYYASSPSRNPQGPSSGQVRSIRGGGYGNIYAAEVRTTFRGGVNPNIGSPAIGFRCAK